ncbi:M3 family metallopeptidase [Polycyclovorans algicola]|uniref:M3 family metallopeptidase n=1 Tax=Polycyclovorans algicola TaxID=616992 RepID=UPI0004A72E36|nr:M3 family metallopeptidase [Polycyclovorans algicola]
MRSDVLPPALPAFDTLDPAAALAHLKATLESQRTRVKALSEHRNPTWETLVEPLDDVSDALSNAWGPISHLFSVTSTPEWRAAHDEGQPLITDFWLELSQSEALCEAYKAIAAREDFAALSPTRQKIVNDALRDFTLSGIGLPADDKARYKALSMALSEKASKFESQLMDAVEAYGLHITDAQRLTGMPESAQQRARAKAKAKNLDGWWIGLDFPSFDAVITYVDDRDLRETLYTAWVTRASDQGPLAGKFDNGPLMLEILKLRQQKAELLGFAHPAALSLETKMAESVEQVEAFLLDLAQRARPRAQAEWDALQAFARELGGPETLMPWDAAYYGEKLKDRELGLSDEVLKPYFPVTQVIQGLFDLVESLYGVRIEPIAGISTWHADVTTYAVRHANGEITGLFYLDPYARDQKRGGAWMDECLGRHRRDHDLQVPVAYLVCNFTPPHGDEPGLLTHDEVTTLFHEFGHGLHHLLTQVDEAGAAGIRGVEWDAVELPSQFMENWCYHPETLKRFARHYQTGEPLPEALIDQLTRARTWQSGLSTVRQVEFALFDLRLHRDPPADTAGVLALLEQVRDEVAVTRPPAFNRMPWSFSHIFAGGYAAGYYSYKWAEVLSADAFAAFEESDFDPQTGQRFRDAILARGGSAPAIDLFTEFRGRAPEPDALLRHSGLLAA